MRSNSRGPDRIQFEYHAGWTHRGRDDRAHAHVPADGRWGDGRDARLGQDGEPASQA